MPKVIQISGIPQEDQDKFIKAGKIMGLKMNSFIIHAATKVSKEVIKKELKKEKE